MDTYQISNGLLESKVSDYQLNSGLMPKKARIMSKLFAKSLGYSAGKVISVYDNMFSQIEEGNSIDEIKKSLEKDIDDKSKVRFKLPLMKPKQASICGLVALKYSGFFDREVEFYSSLMKTLKENNSSVNT